MKTIALSISNNEKQNFVNNSYVRAFTTKETTAMLVPNFLIDYRDEIMSEKTKEEIKERASKIAMATDALVISGGADLNPLSINDEVEQSDSFNITRDYVEKALFHAFVSENKPIFGICRGLQLIGQIMKFPNFSQQLPAVSGEHNAHRFSASRRSEPIHHVTLAGKYLEYMTKKIPNIEQTIVNSWHHQGFTIKHHGKPIVNEEERNTAIKAFEEASVVGEMTKVILHTDSIVEGIEIEQYKIVAVQYHPEENDNSPIIGYFIEKYLKD